MQNVRANVKVLKLKSFCIFLVYHTNKAIETKAYDRRASRDFGTF